MQHFPIFLDLAQKRVVLVGGGEAALAKLRLLLKTEARIEIFATDPAPDIISWAEDGRLTLIRRAPRSGDFTHATLAYAASEDDATDTRTATLARGEGILTNIVDNLGESEFITPAIVDRDPVTVAIGTEGAAPVLARAIKADLEDRLHPQLGRMARAGKAFRKAAEALPFGRPRRDFWRDWYFGRGAAARLQGRDKDLSDDLQALLEKHLGAKAEDGRVDFVGAGPGDPELLTLKARKALDRADVILHDRLVAREILELARREATLISVGKEGFGPSVSQNTINDLLVTHAQNGAHVVRLKSGDPTVFGRLDEELDAVAGHGIAHSVIPGITAASASVAAIGQSLTRRGRNSAVRLVTGHDMAGYADHDWRSLARPGEVAAIYMGKRAARFVQGRLMMHGADPATPITVVENASRPDQRVVGARLATLSDDLTAARLAGPALMLLGLAPRAAEHTLATLQEELA